MDAISAINNLTAIVDALGSLLAHLGVVLATLSTTASAASALIPRGTLPDAAHSILDVASLNVNHATNAGAVDSQQPK